MKTSNLIKTALILLTGMVLSLPLQADNEKYHRYVRLASVKMIPNIDLSGHFFLTLTLPFDRPVEDWMFESGYLTEESSPAVESWMFEEDYLDQEATGMESWMFSDRYLTADEASAGLEPWMLDATYLSK